jgi:tetratricopeptide (TPR) repeat protein
LCAHAFTQPYAQGNIAFRKGDYLKAVKHYETAYDIEPEVPHYQLNLAAAHLKLNKYGRYH